LQKPFIVRKKKKCIFAVEKIFFSSIKKIFHENYSNNDDADSIDAINCLAGTKQL